ncbi:MAG: hypothetical protein WBA57_03570 [Elainellaceae cyanobacterium]
MDCIVAIAVAAIAVNVAVRIRFIIKTPDLSWVNQTWVNRGSDHHLTGHVVSAIARQESILF